MPAAAGQRGPLVRCEWQIQVGLRCWSSGACCAHRVDEFRFKPLARGCPVRRQNGLGRWQQAPSWLKPNHDKALGGGYRAPTSTVVNSWWTEGGGWGMHSHRSHPGSERPGPGTHCLPHETMPCRWVRVGWAGLGQPQLPLDPTRAGPELSSSSLALPQSPSARRRMEKTHCRRSHPGCARPGPGTRSLPHEAMRCSWVRGRLSKEGRGPYSAQSPARGHMAQGDLAT